MTTIRTYSSRRTGWYSFHFYLKPIAARKAEKHILELRLRPKLVRHSSGSSPPVLEVPGHSPYPYKRLSGHTDKVMEVII